MYFINIKMLLCRIELRKLLKPKKKTILLKRNQCSYFTCIMMQDVCNLCSEEMKYKLHCISIFLIVNTHLQ